QNSRGINARLYAEGTSVRNSAALSSEMGDSHAKTILSLSFPLAFPLKVVSTPGLPRGCHVEASFASARDRYRSSPNDDVRERDTVLRALSGLPPDPGSCVSKRLR